MAASINRSGSERSVHSVTAVVFQGSPDTAIEWISNRKFGKSRGRWNQSRIALVLVARPSKQIRWQLVDSEFWRRNDHSDRQELMAIKVKIGDWSCDGSKQKSIGWASGALRSHGSVAVRTGLDAPLLAGLGVPFGIFWGGTRYHRLPHEKGSGASRATDLRRSDRGDRRRAKR